MADPFICEVTMEQGQLLLKRALTFTLPEKIGDKLSYTSEQRAIASMDVVELYRILREHSPMVSMKHIACFGPEDIWQPVGNSGDAEASWKLITPDAKLRIAFSEAARSGAYWCLLLHVHPLSKDVLSAGYLAETIWPLAEALRFEATLRKAIGIPVERQVIEFDP